jgi:hypothetical protein
MRILCTGNPDKKTIAWAVREKWPHAQTISLSKGHDLCMQKEQDIQKFKEKILSCNIFINASYINEQAQSTMLELAVQEWMAKDIKGHVFTIGTTLEWDTSNNSTYKNSKIKLRDLSLYYNNQTGLTGVKSTYIILGGVKTTQSESQDAVDPNTVADIIEWISSQSERIGLIQIDSIK